MAADMKTISVTVDDDTHRRLRIMAAEQSTSVSAMIREHMLRVVNGNSQENTEETEPERRRRRLKKIWDDFQRRGIGISMKDNQTREEMYQRGAPR